MWCLVGNVVGAHVYGEAHVGEVRYGSKQFSRGTKVYCLPAQWGDGFASCVAVGIARGSRRWITVVMPTALIENWRAKVVYEPHAIARLREGYKGFNSQWASRDEIEEYIQLVLPRIAARKVDP